MPPQKSGWIADTERLIQQSEEVLARLHSWNTEAQAHVDHARRLVRDHAGSDAAAAALRNDSDRRFRSSWATRNWRLRLSNENDIGLAVPKPEIGPSRARKE